MRTARLRRTTLTRCFLAKRKKIAMMMMMMRSRVTIIIPAVVVVIVARIMSGGEGIISLGRNSPNERSFIGNLVRDIRNTRRLVINGTGSTLRDYVYIDDLCRILELLVPLRFSGVLNVATGQSQTISDIADLVGKSLNLAFERTHAGPDEWRGFDLTFDTRTLKSLFPDFRFSDLEVGIGHYL